MNKRGVNTIIATVLLILLVLVMIFLIWIFIKNFTQSGSEQIPYSSQCIKIGVEPVKCIYATQCSGVIPGATTDTTVAGIRVRRTSEPGTLSGLAFLFEDENKSIRRVDNTQSPAGNALPREGEYALISLFLNGSFVPANVNVASILGAQKHVCEFTSPSITCFNELGQKGTCADQNGDGNVDVNDFSPFQSNYALKKSYPYGDINGDGLWDFNDFVEYCISWNAKDTSGCPA